MIPFCKIQYNIICTIGIIAMDARGKFSGGGGKTCHYIFPFYFIVFHFLQRFSIACYTERCIPMIDSVRPSVRLSLAVWYRAKTSKRLKLGSCSLH